MLQLLALAASRHRSPFLTGIAKAQEETTKLAVQLAGAFPNLLNLSLVDALACSIAQTRPQFLMRTWDSHTATNRLLSDLSGLSESRTCIPASRRQPQPRMSYWKRSPKRLLVCTKPSAAGRGLGFINRKYFEYATWEPLLSTEMGRGQYGRFVASMIERIRLGETSYDEIIGFVWLVATEHNWDFMKAAMPFLPKLKEQYPHEIRNFETALMFLLSPIIRRRSVREIQNTIPVSKSYENGLSKSETQLLRRNMFGPDQGAVESAGMKRLFKSTLEMGYPQPALDQSMREAEERGTDIERCCEGLPTNLMMPRTDTRSVSFSSSSHNHEASTLGILTPNTSAYPSRVPSPSAIEANGPSDDPLDDLLTELPIDGIDTPVPRTPHKIRPSHRELDSFESFEILEAFGAFLASEKESANYPLVSPAKPPGIQRTPAERKIFKTYYEGPASMFLNYFRNVEQVLDSPPIAAAQKPMRTVTKPVTIPTSCIDR